MIDALPSEPSKDGVAAARLLHSRLIIGAAAALVIVAGAFVWRIAASHSPPSAPPTTNVAAAARNPVLDELVETTKALQDSQQQAIDQLQVLQQLLSSQQAEIKKSSDEIAALSDKLESLRQSFASLPAPAPVTAEADAPQRGDSRSPTVRSHRHRVASGRVRAAHH